MPITLFNGEHLTSAE